MKGHEIYAKLWELAQKDNTGDYGPKDGILMWLEEVAFPALVGEGHCHRCHGFEDGPCHDEDGGYHNCPACKKVAMLTATGQRPIHVAKENEHCVLCASGEHQRITAEDERG